MSDTKFKLDEMKKATIANINRILAKGGLVMVAKAKQTLLDNKNYSSGTLLKSITAITNDLTLEFGTNVDYAITIETGVVNKSVSVNDIQSWLKRKIQLGHIEDKSILGFAKKITNNINNSGRIKNWNPFLEPAYNSTIPTVEKELKNALVQGDK
jgi:hypothetical protein